MVPWEKRASSGNSGEAKCDHTDVEVGDARKRRGRRVVKPVEVWAGSGRNKTDRVFMQSRSVLCGSYGTYQGKEWFRFEHNFYQMECKHNPFPQEHASAKALMEGGTGGG